jgi:transcriptional regulator with PAS, ATPase and Fis domain
MKNKNILYLRLNFDNGTFTTIEERRVLPRSNPALRKKIGRPRKYKKIKENERHMIEDALKQFNGNRSLAASYLGIGERTLYRKIKFYSL